MAVLVLSDEDWSYLERQARRRRVARSLSDRCRMILRCADGLTNNAVAIELGVHEHTVGKWRRRFLKERIVIFVLFAMFRSLPFVSVATGASRAPHRWGTPRTRRVTEPGSEFGRSEVPRSNAARAASRCYGWAYSVSRMRGGSAIFYALRRLVLTPHESEIYIQVILLSILGFSFLLTTPSSNLGNLP